MKLSLAALLGSLVTLFASVAYAADVRPAKPNILLILADDVGYSDLSCYGSEIATPNLDQLAAHGLRFTQFYNGARCCPSRASIMTGLYPHQAGFPGMSGMLPANCVTIPEVLRGAGYRTFIVGKWHLSPIPVKRGFEEFYGMLGGFNSCWQEQPFYSRLPAGRPKREYAPGKFYSTDVFTDYALDFIGEARGQKKPWFLYLAYNAAHFPLHAPKEEIAKYAKLYEQGWDKIRQQRYARQKELGLLGADWPLSPRSVIPPNRVAKAHGWAQKQNPAWDALDADRRADLARRMAVYAAMVDRMDQGIGRVVADLKAHGELDNTLLFFLSDNGACAEWDPFGFDKASGPANVLHRGADLEAMGGPASYFSYGSGWANACNTPFRLYKHYSHEGGISTPLLIHWPAGMKRQGQFERQPGHIFDLLPTCADVAGARYPAAVHGVAIQPAEGRSLVGAMRGEPAVERPFFFEHEGNRAVRAGKWKLVSLAGGPWELYDMEADRVELNDLASQQPARVAQLAKQWEGWAARCHVEVKVRPVTAPPPRALQKTID